MTYSAYTKALVRLLLSVPLIAALFGSMALPSLYDWSRLYAPNWAETFAFLENNKAYFECSFALLLAVIHYPVYLRGFAQIRGRRPGTDAMIAVSTGVAFLFGALPLILDWTATWFSENPLYASTMSALSTFDAVSHASSNSVFPSFFHLIGLWLLFLALSDFLRAHAAVLSAHAESSGSRMREREIYRNLVPFSCYAAMLSLLLTFLCGLAWLLLGVSLPFTLSFSLFVLLSAAPCSLPLAEAIPLWVGTAILTERDVSLRSFRAIETAALSDTLVLGKSDILTEGEPQITDLVPEGITMTAFMALAAAAESVSRHPIAKAISEHAIRLRAKYGRIAAFNESPGEGAEVLMNGAPIRVGRREWIESQGVRISANLITKDDQLAEKGKTILYVSNGKNAKGIIAYEYDLNTETAETVRALENQGVETILMIGEGARTAKTVAKRLGVPNYRHSIRTVDLVREIQLLQAHGKNVALFANLPEDSPAIRQADCPILPQLRTDGGFMPESDSSAPNAVIDAAPISGQESTSALPALVVKNLTSLPGAHALLKSIHSTARQNTIGAFSGPLLALPISSGFFVTLGGPIFPAPWVVALAAIPGLLVTVANAVRVGREFLNERKGKERK